LAHSAAIAQIKESHATVVTQTMDPARKNNVLAIKPRRKLTARMSFVKSHEGSFLFHWNLRGKNLASKGE
jgi:hypothetical protein